MPSLGFIRTLFMVLVTVAAAAVAHSQTRPGPQQPLSTDEMRQVLEEIGAVNRVEIQKMDGHAVRAATPQRIQRLFGTPQVLGMNVHLRENALIFAGQGPLLSFEKPSDVRAKVSAWFAQPAGPAAQREEGRRFHLPYLYGPFAHWEDEPAAFVGLWNCMPEAAWVRPDADPFGAEPVDRHTPGPGMLNSIQGGESSFGQCIREFTGTRGRSAMSPKEAAAFKAQLGRSADRMANLLSDKFSRFLTRHGCEGTGPEDCLLLLHLWSSLSPGDPRLASALQAPGFQKAPRNASAAPQAPRGKNNLQDSGIRQAVLLRAKLSSAIHARQAWPAQTLPALLRQMTRQAHGPQNDIDQISPWALLREQVGQRDWVRAAVLSEINQIGDGDLDCKVHEAWFGVDSPALSIAYALHQLQENRYGRCGETDWRKLKRDESTGAAMQRDSYLAALDRTRSGRTRESILSGLSDDGNDCFSSQPPTTIPAWQAAMCKRWVHEPQTTPLAMKNSRLTLDKAHRFEKLRFDRPADPDSRASKENQADWLAASLRPGMRADAVKKVRVLAADLRRQDAAIKSVTLWRHPGHSRSLLQVDLNDGNLTRLHWLLTPHSLQPLQIPGRFDMDRHRQEIARVSDLDADGNLELWWAESFDDCQGNEGDLQRELDCSAKSADMGEISGDTLSYFVRGRDKARGNTLASSADENWTSRGRTQPFARPAVPYQGHVTSPCNARLVGRFLSEALGISFGSGGRFDRGDVITLDCKPHPTQPDRTIVALFHDAPDGASTPGKGFALAVVDVKRQKVFRIHQSQIEEDATTRIESGGLEVDTAPYQLAPRVRALGIRMHITHNPRYADGGEENYLWLFVEQGRVLRPVLSNMATHHWRFLDSSCLQDADSPCLREVNTTTLSVAASRTGGWHDLDTIVTTRIEDHPSVPQRTRWTGKLRLKNGQYQWPPRGGATKPGSAAGPPIRRAAARAGGPAALAAR